MSECNLELHFATTNAQWLELLPTLASDKAQQNWWASLLAAPYEEAEELKCLFRKKAPPSLELVKCEGNRFSLNFVTGSIGFELAENLVYVLHAFECSDIEAMVFTDECEYITDSEGVNHPIGIRYFINADGELDEADYPEVEYEYY